MLDLYHYVSVSNNFHRYFNDFDSAPTAAFASSNLATKIKYGSTTLNYTFDANGNMVSEGASRSFEWDYGDRMRGFAEGSSVQAAYLYDGGGNRVKKIVVDGSGNSVVTVYIDGGFEHLYKLSSAAVISEAHNEVHVMDGRSRIAVKRVGSAFSGDSSPAVRYNLEDHLGNSSVTVDSSGSLISREEYFPFGETSFGSYSKKRYRFCGKERDEESGLYYYGARYYAAWTCRFVSIDPLAGDYPFYTPYQYAGNQPINFVDLDGLEQGVHDKNDVIGGAIAGKEAFWLELPKNLYQLSLGPIGLWLTIADNIKASKESGSVEPLFRFYTSNALPGPSKGFWTAYDMAGSARQGDLHDVAKTGATYVESSTFDVAVLAGMGGSPSKSPLPETQASPAAVDPLVTAEMGSAAPKPPIQGPSTGSGSYSNGVRASNPLAQGPTKPSKPSTIQQNSSNGKAFAAKVSSMLNKNANVLANATEVSATARGTVNGKSLRANFRMDNLTRMVDMELWYNEAKFSIKGIDMTNLKNTLTAEQGKLLQLFEHASDLTITIRGNAGAPLGLHAGTKINLSGINVHSPSGKITFKK